jgi:hypothetical protein
MEKKGFVEGLCAIFERQGVVTSQQSRDLKKNFEGRSDVYFEDFLLEEGLIDKEAILKALSEYYATPSMDPVGYFFDHYLLIKFPKDLLLRSLAIPIEVIDDNILMVLANDPSDEEIIAQLGRYVSYDIEFRVGIASEIIESIEEFYDKSLTDRVLDDDVIPEHETLEEQEHRIVEDFSEEE